MENPSKLVEYNFEASAFAWEISDGKVIEAWGFNRQLPGPELRASVGDTLVVRLTNNLNEPTTIHWHGIRLPASMDGTQDVQKPIAPGEIFEYRFVLPDAGTFWYHAHTNETVQMERGMYGALIVEGESEPIVDKERIFLIDDMKLNSKNEFTSPGWFLPRSIERHDGRQGNTLLLNGKENMLVSMHGGQTERWRFINASSARYFYLTLGGKPFKIIGTDGGLLEYPVMATTALITPGERLDIVVGPFKEGEEFGIESLAYNRTTILKAKNESFASVKVGATKPTKAFMPERLRTIESLAPKNAIVTRRIDMSVRVTIQNGDFRINNGSHGHDKPVRVGELQVWEIVNLSLMDHPFHLHGFFFQVLEENGKTPAYKAWKDTYNLTPKGTIKIAWMPDNRPGRWMYHCHIIEHHAAGMMASFDVISGDGEMETVKPIQHHHH